MKKFTFLFLALAIGMMVTSCDMNTCENQSVVQEKKVESIIKESEAKRVGYYIVNDGYASSSYTFVLLTNGDKFTVRNSRFPEVTGLREGDVVKYKVSGDGVITPLEIVFK